MRTRNTAIWPRVTVPSGQYVVGEHPAVIPSRASCSIHFANACVTGTSVNIVPVASGGWYPVPCLARRRNNAIWPRVTPAPGQYIRGVIEHPAVIPSVANCSIHFANG